MSAGPPPRYELPALDTVEIALATRRMRVRAFAASRSRAIRGRTSRGPPRWPRTGGRCRRSIRHRSSRAPLPRCQRTGSREWAGS